MADIVTLDDGRKLYGSSLGVSGLLSLIAKYISADHLQLARWLNDVSNRPNGMMGIDLRGLSDEHRQAIHYAARAAYDHTIGLEPSMTNESPSLSLLAHFIDLQSSIQRRESPDHMTDCEISRHAPFPEDINDLWEIVVE